ncbi:hypothetical protein M8J76_012039, partial [Diaphorina citri]
MYTNLTSSTYVPFYYSWIVAYNIADIVRFTNPPLNSITIHPNFTTTQVNGADYHSRHFCTDHPYKTYNFTKPNSTAFMNAFGEMRFVRGVLCRKFNVLKYDSDVFLSDDKLEKTHMGHVNNIVVPNMFRVAIVAEEFRNKTFEEVLIITSMIVDSKKIRHLTTHKKVPRNRTSTTMTNIPVTKPTYGGIHPYEFEFPFPTTENLVRIYETLYDYPHAWNSEEFSDMMNPPANISAYENLKYPFTLDETVTYFNHLERNFKEEVLYALNNSFLKPIHLNMSEDMKYWRIITKVPDKYWPNKEHVYNLHIVSDKFRNWHHLKVSKKMSIYSKMSLSLVVSCLAFLLSVNILALETTTGEASYESMIRDFVPILKKEFNPTYINFRPLILPEEQYIYDEWGTTCDEKNRATICRLIIVSEAFRNFSKDD